MVFLAIFVLAYCTANVLVVRWAVHFFTRNDPPMSELLRPTAAARGGKPSRKRRRSK